MTKICTKCGIDKPYEDYYIRKTGRLANKPRSTCKLCDKQYRLANKSYFENYRLKYKNKHRLHGKLYYITNIDEIKINHKIYHINNREKDNQRVRNWRANNKERFARKIKEYKYKQLNTNPLYKAIQVARNVVIGAIKRRGYKKNSKTEKIIGCSFKEFKQYIENQFKPDMTWFNHGKWEMHHIIHISSAKNEEDIIKLSHYTNLQPLWWEEHLKKHNKKAN